MGQCARGSCHQLRLACRMRNLRADTAWLLPEFFWLSGICLEGGNGASVVVRRRGSRSWLEVRFGEAVRMWAGNGLCGS